MKKINSFGKGFTLLELLISIAIFTILLAIVITGFQDTRKLERIKDAALTLASNIQKAQNYALTGFVTNSIVPIGGYGVHLKGCSSEYSLFADSASFSSTNCISNNTLGNQRYDTDFDPTCIEQKVGGSISLPSGVTIFNIKSNGTVISGSASINQTCDSSQPSVDITFKAPQRSPYLGFGDTNQTHQPDKATLGNSIDIYLFLSDKKVCRKVSIDAIVGRVTETSTVCP